MSADFPLLTTKQTWQVNQEGWPAGTKGIRMMFMRFAVATIFTTLISQNLSPHQLFAFSSPFQNHQTLVSNGGNPTNSPADLLKLAVDIAKQGDILAGLVKAKDARQLAEQSGQFHSMMVIEYLNTLQAMIEAAQVAYRAELLNEAVATIDTFKGQAEFDGRGNPEGAYYFMVATGKIADGIWGMNEQDFILLQKLQGTIAQNLLKNPSYPVDGKKFLAEPLFDLSLALALENNVPVAKALMTEGYGLGFCEFEKMEDSPVWLKAKQDQDLRSHFTQLHQHYLESLRTWSAKELEQFDPFRFNFHVDSIRGGTLSSRDYDGKILVVDLWATWCQPCREALPHFDHLNKDYRRYGVRVVGISMDSPDAPDQSRDTVRDFLAQNEIRIPCGLGSNEIKNCLPAEMKLPTTLFIDRSGTVRYVASGYQDYAKIAAITETLVDEKMPVQTDSDTNRSIQ
jgi:thiol-disulfide isomerase/thioredoxin